MQGDGKLGFRQQLQLEEAKPGRSPTKSRQLRSRLPSVQLPWDVVPMEQPSPTAGRGSLEEGKPQNSLLCGRRFPSRRSPCIPFGVRPAPGIRSGEVAPGARAPCHPRRDTGSTQGPPQARPTRDPPNLPVPRSARAISQPKFGLSSTSPSLPRAKGSSGALQGQAGVKAWG